MDSHPKGLFVTGTDTDVGKTFIACGIAKTLKSNHVNVGVYKPVASGCTRHNGDLMADDGMELWQAAGMPKTLNDVCPLKFEAPIAPHLAARAEGCELRFEDLVKGANIWKDSEVLIVEGAGGLMSPLTSDEYVADLAYALGFPLIVVVPNQLGAINQTLQTLVTAATFHDGLNIGGIILNSKTPSLDRSCEANLQELQRRCVPPVLAVSNWKDDSALFAVDWMSICLNQEK